MKRICIFLVYCFFISCVKDQPKIRIVNNSGMAYDSIHIFALEYKKTVFKNIKPGDKMEGVIVFDDKNTGDGCYKLLLFKNEDLIKNECFGYYTNGKSLDRKFNITIETDTIKIVPN